MPFSKRDAATRFIAVTALVLVLGALAGAVTGFTLTAIGDLVSEGGTTTGRGRVYGIGAMLGAVFGAAVGTPIALIMLRRVPLWRATVETAAAAGVGTVIGRVIPIPLGFVIGAIAFAMLAALRLRRAYSPVRDGAPTGDRNFT